MLTESLDSQLGDEWLNEMGKSWNRKIKLNKIQ